jgi:Carboxypeptidase regulatory-like domain
MRKAIILVCMLHLIFVGLLRAQTNRATITGTVTDSSGASMAGIEVSVKSLGTNVLTTTHTNDDGIYSVPNLFPGAYSVEFKRDGFKSVLYKRITLESTQVAQLNARLQVGAVSDNITVTADAPVLDHENEAIGTNMKGDVVTDLPLSIYGGGRFVEDFAVAITPGYSPISNPFTAVVNGTQNFTKDYTVDGTSATASIAGDSFETGPSFEAVEEVQATTSGLDSASAITSGGVMAFNLKSGTNKFHGSAFGYGHNELLDANTWTNDGLGLPKTKKRAWDYGGSLGGPIFRNKTFFFGTFERYTQTDFTLSSASAFVPTADFLNGNFSALLGSNLCADSTGSVGNCGQSNGMGGTFSNSINVQNNAGQTIPLQAGMIFDPQTGKQFTGNMIPTSRFSNVSKQIIGLYQKDYAPAVPGINQPNNRGLLNSTPAQTPNQAVIKLDHNLTERDRLSGSWIYNHRPRTLVDSGGIWQAGSTDGGPLSAAGLQLVRSDAWRVSESHTFSPSLLNVFNLTYNWYWNGKIPTNSGTNWNSQLGFGDTGSHNFPFVSFGGVPTNVNAQAVTFIGTGSGTGPNNASAFQGNFTGATVITGDTVTWTKGRHTFSFGGEFRAYQVNSHTGSGALGFSFTNDGTGQPQAAFGPSVGYGFASFLLGDVTTASASTAFDLYGRRKALALFGQDSYKVTPKLTLSLGLRWGYTFRYHEKYGHWANFDLNAIDPTLGIPGTLVFAKNGSDSFEKNEYATNFGPQVGLAYSPWRKWVFRGSFGIIYVPPAEPYFAGVPNGFAPGFQGTNNATTPFNWDSGYQGVFKPGSPKNASAFNQFPLVSVDPSGLRAGYTDAFNVGAQYELTPTTRLEIAYVGNRGHRLSDTALAWNEPSTAAFQRVVSQNPGINGFSNDIFCNTKGAPVPTDLNGQALVGITCPYAGFFGSALATIAPYPQVAAAATTTWFFYNQLYVELPRGQSYYDSMIVDLTKRAGRGLTMDLNYTLSRSEGDTFTQIQETNGFYTPVQDFANVAQAAHTLTNFDQKHVVKGFVSYDLPFGRGRRWLSNHGSAVNSFVGGWTLASLVLYTSGQPFQAVVDNPFYPVWGTFYPNFNLSGFHGPSDPHNFQIIPQPTPSNPNPQPGPGNFYLPQNQTVVTAPAVGQLGNGPSAIAGLRCQGSANENASILKNFSLGADGRYRLQFRVEYYNIFNRHYYDINGCGGRKTAVGHSDFAQIFGVNDNPRNGQFAIRFQF